MLDSIVLINDYLIILLVTKKDKLLVDLSTVMCIHNLLYYNVSSLLYLSVYNIIVEFLFE